MNNFCKVIFLSIAVCILYLLSLRFVNKNEKIIGNGISNDSAQMLDLQVIDESKLEFLRNGTYHKNFQEKESKHSDEDKNNNTHRNNKKTTLKNN